MAINFSIGDTVTVNTANLEALPVIDPKVRAAKELLGGMDSTTLYVSDLGVIGLKPHYFIQVVPSDKTLAEYRGGQGSIAFFESESQINSVFVMQTDTDTTPVRVLCINAGTSILPAATVVSRANTDATPGVVIADIKTNRAVFGITENQIAPGAAGYVVTQGMCRGLGGLSDAKQGERVYLGNMPGTVSTHPSIAYSSPVGTVAKGGTGGIVIIQQQPGGLPGVFEARLIDGSNNNLSNPSWGTAGTCLARITPYSYSDGVSAPAGIRRPSARKISNVIAAQATSIPNTLGRSDFVWVWGQYVDHDIGLTETHSPAESFNIPVPADDAHFTPGSVIALNRSVYDTASNPREQCNEITSYIDASNVYGSSESRRDALRENDGSGKLKTSSGNLLPYNTGGLHNAPTDSNPALFIAGDIRANEEPLLICMHTLWMREHNRLCDEIVAAHPTLTGDQIFETARRKNIALVQAITYREFLPALLGVGAIPEYSGYCPVTNTRIFNIFSTAAFRLGHSMLSSNLQRLDSSNQSIAEGPLALRNGFFAPTVVSSIGLDPYIRGASRQLCQNIDNFTIDEIRNFLFGMPNAGGFDLAALNIQRGRDHGLAGYNVVRKHLGLASKDTFSEISSNTSVNAALESLYSSTDEIDVWVGGLAEDHVAGSMLGELFHTICVRQFAAFRDGDRFWYENIFSGTELDEINNTKLSDVIRRNTSIGSELSDDVFNVPA